MAKAMSLDEYIRRANLVHNNFYDYSNTVYRNMSCKISITCPLHGQFEQLPQAHLRGQGCPVCGREKSKSSLMKKYGVDNPMKVKEFQDKARETCRDKYGTDWAMSTQEVRDKVSNTNLERYGVERPLQNANIKQKANATLFDRYGVTFEDICSCDEVSDKLRNSCLEKYGSDTYLGSSAARDVIRMTCQEKYGGNAPMCSDAVKERARLTNLERYGVDYVTQLSSIKDKICLSKSEHGTFGTSSSEEILYDKLCKVFGNDDVKRQYRSDFYPYSCDFYIVSRNMYVELNASWTHGGHWYDPDCEADVLCKDLWLLRGTKYYLNAVHTWTVADVNKHLCAIRNKLNYVVFWNTDLTDAQMWFDKGCPDKLLA